LFLHPIQYQIDSSQHSPYAVNYYLVPLMTCMTDAIVVAIY